MPELRVGVYPCRRCGARDRTASGHCRPCQTKYQKTFRERHPGYDAHAKRKYNYGITTEQFQHMVETQAGLCAMCCEPMVPGKGTHVDHDHATNEVRGLLCQRCNIGLAYLENRAPTSDANEYLRVRA